MADSKDILQLVVQREQARFGKDFSEADSLRSRLQTMGVTVFDKTSTWRHSDGRSGRIPSWADLEGGHTAESLAALQRQREAAASASAAGGAADAAEARIRQLVKQREQARANKDFSTSDTLRDELKELGVELFDKEKIWRSTTGHSGCIIGFGTAGGVMDLEICALVVQREKARQTGDWGTADMIRNELKSHGVEIYDKDKVWKSSEGRQGCVPSYSAIQEGIGMSPEVTNITQGFPVKGAGKRGFKGGNQAQQQLIQVALQAAQSPAAAANMLSKLGLGAGGRKGYGSGRGGNGGSWQPLPEARDAMLFLKNSQGSALTDSQIEWLVGVREKVRHARDFGTSDELRHAMRGAGIEVLDKETRWSAKDGRSGHIPSWDSLGLSPTS